MSNFRCVRVRNPCRRIGIEVFSVASAPYLHIMSFQNHRVQLFLLFFLVEPEFYVSCVCGVVFGDSALNCQRVFTRFDRAPLIYFELQSYHEDLWTTRVPSYDFMPVL